MKVNLFCTCRVASVVLGLGLGLLLAGCSEDVARTDPHIPILPEPEQTTVSGLLDVFGDAHKDRDIDAFAECLHPEYVFWFSEDDRNSPTWDWKDFIDRPEDRDITTKMFDAESVIGIGATFTNLTPDPDTLGLWVGEDLGVPEPSTYYWGVFAVDMHVVERTGDSEIDCWVDGRARIYVRPDPALEGLWTLWKIEDLGKEHKEDSSGSSRATWGKVKKMFK